MATWWSTARTIRLTQERDPANLKWDEVGADVVIEATGLFLDEASAASTSLPVPRRCFMSAPSKDDTPMFVFGVNHDTTPARTSSPTPRCTTNCLAPVAKVLNDKWGIKRGLMTTVHAATATQKTVDGPQQQGLARWPWHSGKHHPFQHRRCQGRGRGDSGAEQEADRHELPRAHLRRVGGRLDRRAGQRSRPTKKSAPK